MTKDYVQFTLSSKDSVDLSAPSGRPKGKQNLKFEGCSNLWLTNFHYERVVPSRKKSHCNDSEKSN